MEHRSSSSQTTTADDSPQNMMLQEPANRKASLPDAGGLRLSPAGSRTSSGGQTSMATVHDKYVMSETVVGVGLEISVVKRAVQRFSGKNVAVKTIAKDKCTERAKVVVTREVSIGKSLPPHPNIVPIYEVFESTRNVYLVMEEANCDLCDLLEEKGVLCEEDAAKLFIQVMTGLDAMHRMGFAHRDVKPENILVTNGGAVAKLCDFGMAKGFDPALPDNANPLKTVCGSRLYMAPEVLQGKAYNKACDVWGAAVVLCIMLTNAPPFDMALSAPLLVEAISNYRCELSGGAWEDVSPQAISMLRSLFTPPETRPSCLKVLMHEWVKLAHSGVLNRDPNTASTRSATLGSADRACTPPEKEFPQHTSPESPSTHEPNSWAHPTPKAHMEHEHPPLHAHRGLELPPRADPPHHDRQHGEGPLSAPHLPSQVRPAAGWAQPHSPASLGTPGSVGTPTAVGPRALQPFAGAGGERKAAAASLSKQRVPHDARLGEERLEGRKGWGERPRGRRSRRKSLLTTEKTLELAASKIAQLSSQRTVTGEEGGGRR